MAIVALAPVRQGLLELSRALRAGTLRWPALLGGVAGAYFVAAQGSVVGAIGVTIFTICVVAGQVLSGGILDALGFIGPRRRLTGLRALGTLLALVAVTVAGSFPAGSPAGFLHLMMAFAAGLGGAWASATAGRVREASASSVVAGIVNFSAALPVLAVLWVVEAVTSHRSPVFTLDARVAISAVIGVGVVCSASRLVRKLGVLLLGLCMVAGQLSVAFAIEIVSGSTDVSFGKFIAAFLICAAVAVASTTASRRKPQQG